MFIALSAPHINRVAIYNSGTSQSRFVEAGECVAALSAGLELPEMSNGWCQFDDESLTPHGKAVVLAAGLLAMARGENRSIPISDFHHALAVQLREGSVKPNELIGIIEKAKEFLLAEWPAVVALAQALKENPSLTRDEIRKIVTEN